MIPSARIYRFIIAISLVSIFISLFLGVVGWILAILLGVILWANISNFKKYYAKNKEGRVTTQFIKDAHIALLQCSDPVKKRIIQNLIDCYDICDAVDDNEKIIAKLQRFSNRNALYIKQHQQNIENLKKKLTHVQYDVDEELSEKECFAYENMCGAFEKMMESQMIWEIVKSEPNSQRKSSVGSFVDKKQSRMYVGMFNYMKSEYDIPVLEINEQRLFLYPKFALLVKTQTDFHVIPYNSLNIITSLSKFQEPGFRPSDSEVIGNTWKFVNKDGSPDQRYNNNSQIPVLAYGRVNIVCPHITASILCSDNRKVSPFGEAFNKYKQIMSFSKTNTHNEATETETIPFYSKIITASTNLYQVLLEMNENPELIYSLSQQEQLAVLDTLPNKGINNRIVYLAYYDIIKCYDGLGHKDLNSNEALGMSIITLQIMAQDNVLWMQEDLLRSKGMSIAMTFYLQYKKGVTINYDSNRFLLLDLLKDANVDKDLGNKFAIALYRFAMTIAQADNCISATEKNWLANIFRFTTESENTKKTSKQKSGGIPRTELKNLIGLENVKAEVGNIYNLIKMQKMRKDKGMKAPSISYHCVFTGNPGTGKTTVARLVAEIYKELGILQKGHLVETDRSGLVAEYVGQTAVKTNKIIDSALDGVLFIDEAYSLVQGGSNDYGMEAISTLLKRMEDNRDRLVVILAGYSDEMKTFIDSNPGLQSRFNRYIHFDDYDTDDLVRIYECNCNKFDYKLTLGAKEMLQQVIDKAVVTKDKNFGNARYIRNLFEKTLERQAKRLASESDISESVLSSITAEDIPQ